VLVAAWAAGTFTIPVVAKNSRYNNIAKIFLNISNLLGP
jgi:hypothetical protein